jgi:hypothetical protein
MARKRTKDDAAQILMFADCLPNGQGGFTIVPKKPLQEIGPVETAKLLNVHRSSLSLIVNYPLAQKLLKWRWSSERQGKRIFELDSVLAYREATKDHEVRETGKFLENLSKLTRAS